MQKTNHLNVNNTESDSANTIFRPFKDAIFSREHTSVKTFTKIIFDLYSGKTIATLSLPNKAAIASFILTTFRGHFLASEPMTLPKSITSHFLQSMRRHFSPVKPRVGVCVPLALIYW